ncbi:MAG TPA: hypothetical protein K8V21_03345 [Weissella thailandensis]|uniref:hypothetical protein n=1 Tax=Weissella thailandensis TaxID=89061 RepID=UPI001E05D640|nr:hypothetical protein [Weissella thailandensis]HJG84415.1 hypothetical protein [Weissella thailandensis]
MKHGKYYATGLVALLLIGGGAGIAINHNDSDNVTESHKSVKSSSSHKHSSSSKSSSSKSSSVSSESVSSESQVSSSETTDVQPSADMTLPEFVNQYGVTPVQWLVQNKGMSVEEALYATPDEQQTSGENQSEWAYRQGTHDDMVAENDDATDVEDDDYWYWKAREDNADYYLEDGTHIQNDDQGHSYDADTGEVIGKGGAGPGHE